MLSEGECEILRKLLELVHQAVLKSGAKDLQKTMKEGGGDQEVVETGGKSRIVEETQIIDMYILCFGVRKNMVN
jgi:hypothetical protein